MVERGKKEKSFFITGRGGAKGALGVLLPISQILFNEPEYGMKNNAY